MLRIDKEESDDDSDNKNKSATTTPQKQPPPPPAIDVEAELQQHVMHVNNVNNVYGGHHQNANVPVLPHVSIPFDIDNRCDYQSLLCALTSD